MEKDFRQVSVLIALLLVAATLAVYWQVQHHKFINFDEQVYITENTHVRQGLTLANLRYAFTSMEAGFWHPLTWLSLMTDRQLFLNNAGGFHWTSLLFHLANTILLFFILLRMTKAPWQSGFAAALFALHPLHVEAVAWVASRKDVLSGFFWMLAMGAYSSYVTRPSLRRYFLVVLSFALGLMAKPMIVTLPFVLLLLDYWPLRSISRPNNGVGTGKLARVPDGKGGSQAPLLFLFLEKMPLVIIAILAGMITIIAEGKAGALASFDSFPFPVRLANALVAYVIYLSMTFWPVGLAAFYPHPAHFPLIKVITAIFTLLGVSLFVFVAGRKRPYLVVGWLWYLGTLLPVIGLMQVGSHAMADRYTYLPLVGIFIMLSWGIAEILPCLPKREAIIAFLAGTLLLALMTLSWRQVSYWQDSYTLFSHALKATDNNWLAHNNLGLVLAEQGKMQEAEEHYRQALRLMPEYYEAHSNLGFSLARQGKREEAVRHYKKALVVNPGYAAAHNNWGMLLAEQGKMPEAEEHYRQALRWSPDYYAAHHNLGIIFARQGRFTEAAAHYLRALAINPENAAAHNNLGMHLAERGAIKEAEEHYRQALRFEPEYYAAHNNLGILLSQQGKYEEAVRHYKKALAIDPDYADAHNNLGIALAQKGKHVEALGHFLEALRLKSDDVQLHYNAGLTYLHLRNYSQAQQHFRKCLVLNKGFGVAKQQLDFLATRKKGE
ncbi:MAG: tetratricopeptide repeat protein [Syntrophales bacterium]|nr:tetratricopeptide repeat protein [Syntrophales bacterium]